MYWFDVKKSLQNLWSLFNLLVKQIWATWSQCSQFSFVDSAALQLWPQIMLPRVCICPKRWSHSVHQIFPPWQHIYASLCRWWNLKSTNMSQWVFLHIYWLTFNTNFICYENQGFHFLLDSEFWTLSYKWVTCSVIISEMHINASYSKSLLYDQMLLDWKQEKDDIQPQASPEGISTHDFI